MSLTLMRRGPLVAALWAALFSLVLVVAAAQPSAAQVEDELDDGEGDQVEGLLEDRQDGVEEEAPDDDVPEDEALEDETPDDDAPEDELEDGDAPDGDAIQDDADADEVDAFQEGDGAEDGDGDASEDGADEDAAGAFQEDDGAEDGDVEAFEEDDTSGDAEGFQEGDGVVEPERIDTGAGGASSSAGLLTLAGGVAAALAGATWAGRRFARLRVR